jgi:hypothetical protein
MEESKEPDQEAKELKKDPDATSEESWNSEYYDSQGNYKWGEEGTDWEFYDQEDKDAFEQGTNKMFEPMNPDAVPTEVNPYVDMKVGTHHKVVVAKMIAEQAKERDETEGVYVTSQKKVKTKKMVKTGRVQQKTNQ